jgi:hypothetical protein
MSVKGKSKTFDRICPKCLLKMNKYETEGNVPRQYFLCECGHSCTIHSDSFRNKEYVSHLREQGHLYFDMIWRAKQIKYPELKAVRPAAYEWLAKAIGTRKKNAHFRDMHGQTILLAIKACAPYYETCYKIIKSAQL